MANEEVSFPRGGTRKKPVTDVTAKQYTADDSLFKTGENDAKYLPKKKKEHMKKTADDISSNNVIEALTIKILSPGMNVLCCIHEVHEYELRVGLPGRIMATIPITNISDSYTNLLQQYSIEVQGINETVVTLQAMFSPGLTFPCKIVEMTKTLGKHDVTASLNPRDINQSLTAANLKHGMVLSTSVASVEDHGYVMDIGMKGIHGFLSVSDALTFVQSSNGGRPLAVGQLVQCIINMPDIDKNPLSGRAVKLSAKPKIVGKSKVTDLMELNLQTILPGMVVPVMVTDVKQKGLIVHSLGFDGFVHKHYLKDVWDFPENYEIGHKDHGVVLYVHPITKNLCISLRPKPTPQTIGQMFQKLLPGDILRKAPVISLEKGAAYLKLRNGTKGIAVGKHLQKQRYKAEEGSSAEVTVGSTHDCRVLSLHYLDQVALVTLDESILQEEYLPREKICVGSVLEGKVKKLVRGGMLLKLAYGVQGFVRDIHMADFPIKYPEKLFPLDKIVKCKVLKADMNQFPFSLFLTCKKSLLESNLPIIDNYEDIKPGIVSEGVVVLVQDQGLLLSFYNDVQGWVPINLLSEYRIDYPEKVFYRGQVVKCTVVSCDPERRNLKLSLIVHGEKQQVKDLSKKVFMKVGDIADAEVLTTTEKGIEMKVISTGKEVFLPKEHLSDFPHLSDIMLQSFSPGTMIKVVCFKTKGTVIVSKKGLMIAAAQKGTLKIERSDLKVGMSVLGVVGSARQYGILVELAGGIGGLISKHLVHDNVERWKQIRFLPGHTVKAKVKLINAKEKKINLSTKLTDCYFRDAEDSLDLLQSYLNDVQIIHKNLKADGETAKLGKYRCGQIIEVYVTAVENTGVLCKTHEGVKGFATNYHLDGKEYSIKDEVMAVVLHVDFESECLELSLSEKLIKHVKISQSSESLKVKEGQILRSTVLLMKRYFVLAVLGDHGVGTLVYLPNLRHPNDIFGRQELYTLGQQYRVVVKRCVNDNILCILEHHDRKVACKASNFEAKAYQLNPIEKIQTMVEVGNADLEETAGNAIKHFVVETSEQNQNSRKRKNKDVEVKIPMKRSKTVDSDTNDLKDKVNDMNIQQGKKRKINGIDGDVPQKQSKIVADVDDFQKQSDKFDDSGAYAVKVGSIYEATIESIKKTQMNILINDCINGRVHVTEAADDVKDECNPLLAYRVGQKVTVKVIGFYVTKSSQYLAISHKVGLLWPECSLRINSDPILDKEFKEGEQVTVFVQRIDQTNVVVYLTPQRKAVINFINLYSKRLMKYKKLKKVLRPGLAINATVFKVHEGKVELSKFQETKIQAGRLIMARAVNVRKNAGLIVRLPLKYRGIIRLTDLSDTYESADKLLTRMLTAKFICCRILTVNTTTKECELSSRTSVVKSAVAQPVIDPVVSETSDLEVGMTLRGFVRSVKSSGIVVTIGRKVKGFLDVTDLPFKMQNNLKSRFKCGKVIQVKIDSIDRETGKIMLVLGDHLQLEDDADDDDQEDISKKEDANESHSSHTTLGSSNKSVDEKGIEHKPCLQLSEGFVWEVDATPNLAVLASKVNDVRSSSGSDSEEEKDKPKKTKTRKERQLELRKEEEYLTKQEHLLLMREREPSCVDDFERLVASSPNSSVVWLQYIAFHLQQAEFDKARAVGNRALQTISFREEQEKLNVWVALLNLENLFGTKESLDNVFQKALLYNDSQKVYAKMAEIYVSSNKMEEAEQIFLKMIKKYKPEKDVWIKYGSFMMTQGRVDEARKLMNRSLGSIDKKEHVDVISKFAQMEFKHGDAERAKTMFQNILELYPKRKDIKTVFEHLTLKQQEDVE